jgi:hypothetical protein
MGNFGNYFKSTSTLDFLVFKGVNSAVTSYEDNTTIVPAHFIKTIGNLNYGVVGAVSQNLTVHNIYLSSGIWKDVLSAINYMVTLVNPIKSPSISSFSPLINATGTVILRFTAGLVLQDSQSTPIQSASVLIQDRYGTQIYSGTTDSQGRIPQQILTYRKWTGTSLVQTNYYPYLLQITKTGYESIVQFITPTRKMKLTLEMKPVSFLDQDRTKLTAIQSALPSTRMVSPSTVMNLSSAYDPAKTTKITASDIKNALSIAPSGGAPAQGSPMKILEQIKTKVDTL